MVAAIKRPGWIRGALGALVFGAIGFGLVIALRAISDLPLYQTEQTGYPHVVVPLVLVGVLPMLYLTWSLKYGAVAGDNPWQATGLEWQTQSPPLTENFAEIPVMDHEAYDYEWLEQKQAREVASVG